MTSMIFVATLANGRRFSADSATSILEAARAEGIILEHSCRTGRCGVCKATAVGATTALRIEESLSQDDAAAGMILTCCRAAASDLSLDIDDLGRLAGIQTRIMPCRIAAIDYPTPTIASVTLRLPPVANFEFLAGQYVNVMAAGQKRSYSLANAPRRDGQLTIIIRAVPSGVLSAYWFGRAKVNDLLRLEGPLGTFFLRDGAGPLIFLATGTGIAPVAALIDEIDFQSYGRDIRVYWGNRQREDFIDIQNLARADVHVERVLSGPSLDWEGARGHVQDCLLASGVDLTAATVYAAGCDNMIKEASRRLVLAGLSERRFYSDSFVTSN